MNIRILWVDDDSEEKLKSVEWLINRQLKRNSNEPIRSVKSYSEAVVEIERGFKGVSPQIHALLLDVELPDARHEGTLARFYGFVLAEKAAELGIRTVVFLTVVEQALVANLLIQLRQKYPGVYFEYYNKLDSPIEAVVNDLLKVK